MESHVPTAFAEVTKCFACDFLEDGRTLVGICTTSGQLLELVDKKVIDSFDIDKVANDIKIFTSYNPVQKYYLVHCKKQLIVIKRAKPLCIIHTYDNVVQVEIRDRLCLGRPQVVVWTLTEKEPIVTDFVSQLQPAGPQAVPNLTIGLSGKLQEMNLRLVKARKLLQEKRKTCVNALYQLTPHLTPPESDTKGEPQVLAWGAPFPAKGAAPQPPLRLSRLWARTHNGQWVVGVPVFNTNHNGRAARM